MKRLIIIGCGGHAKSIADTAEALGYEIVGFTAPEPSPTFGGYPYLGTDDVLADYFSRGVTNAAVGIGFLGEGTVRETLSQRLKTIGYALPTLIDPSAAVAKDATVGEGTWVGKCAVINAGATVGTLCIINSGAVVEHDDRIGDFTHISVRAALCGNVTVHNRCLIGAGSTVIQGVTVGENTVIGAGSTVLRDVPPNSKRHGLVK